MVTPAVLLQPAWGLQLAGRDWTQLALLETPWLGGWAERAVCV